MMPSPRSFLGMFLLGGLPFISANGHDIAVAAQQDGEDDGRSAGSSAGKAIVHNACSFPIWYTHVLPQAACEENEELCGIIAPGLTMLAPGESVSRPYDETHTAGSVYKIFKGDSGLPLQFEHTWAPEQDPPRVYYDASYVDGQYEDEETGEMKTVFGSEGFMTTPKGEHNAVMNTCIEFGCAPGDHSCHEAYLLWNDDHATHACPDSTDITLTICYAGLDFTVDRRTVTATPVSHETEVVGSASSTADKFSMTTRILVVVAFGFAYFG